jgi:AcrR family transcriptional regulator
MNQQPPLPEARTAAEILGIQPPPPRNARDRLVAKAIDLFYKNGLNAVGIDRIIEDTGVTKTTFYKHFESKDELMAEAVRRRDAWENEAWMNAVRAGAGDDPRNQLLGFFDVMDRWFTAADFRGCMFINTAAEFPNRHDPVHQAAAAHKRHVRNVFRDLARAAGAKDPETFADLFTIAVEGTLVLRQVHDRDDAAAVARRLAEQLVEQFIPKPKKPKRSG